MDLIETGFYFIMTTALKTDNILYIDYQIVSTKDNKSIFNID